MNIQSDIYTLKPSEHGLEQDFNSLEDPCDALHAFINSQRRYFFFILPPRYHLFFFFLNDPAPPDIYTLPLHDALPIWVLLDALNQRPAADDDPGLRPAEQLVAAEQYQVGPRRDAVARHRLVLENEACEGDQRTRSEEHTSGLQSPCNLVCRLLLGNKKL